MIKHDDKYLYGGGVEYDDDPEGLFLEFIRVAKSYHEHMTRWRTMAEVPEIGQLIEVTYAPEDEMGVLQSDGRFSDRVTYEGFMGLILLGDDGEIRLAPYAWRPVSELPDAV